MLFVWQKQRAVIQYIYLFFLFNLLISFCCCCWEQEQLAKLMAILHHTHPSFVRCLIPNEQKQPGERNFWLMSTVFPVDSSMYVLADPEKKLSVDVKLQGY